MPELQKVAHGEPNWDAKVNAAIELLNATQDELTQKKVTGWSSDGIVFSNGFHQDQDPTKYRYVQLTENAKLVELFVSVWGKAKKGSQLVLTLPDIVKPNAYIDKRGWGQITIDHSRLWVEAATDSSSDNDHVIVAQMMYLSVN